jgi:hypothetical protein
VRQALLVGVLGEGAAVEFTAFLDISDKLPDLDAALKNPDKAKIPKELNVLYAMCAGLAAKVQPKNFEQFLTLVGRMPKEFEVFAVKLAYRANAKIASSPAFTKWATKHRDVLG